MAINSTSLKVNVTSTFKAAFASLHKFNEANAAAQNRPFVNHSQRFIRYLTFVFRETND